ncbi:unnamed protein product, partial [Mesorhabditis belari]|uniref:Uncharacterized protein n=1 Tax=Mesorhabditis belari TaxID=2138241 RepID=A0AAF3F1A9_9BILA
MTLMVIPVSQHKLIKIRKRNRQKLTKIALYCSTAGAFCNLLGSSTDSWISTSEVLKYYRFPNSTEYSISHDGYGIEQVYFKNATLGPWTFCWSDPTYEFDCYPVNYWIDDEPSDVTTGVQQGVRKSSLFMVLGVIFDLLGALVGYLCFRRRNPYGWLLCSALLHIFAGMTNFLCIIVYMASVSREVGNKIYPASELDDPIFYYHYGFSFILVKCSFLLTETAALLTVVVFMAKRDERTFHRYKMRSLMNFKKITQDGDLRTAVPEATTGHTHARFSSSRHRVSFVGSRGSRTSFDHIYQPSSRMSISSSAGRVTPTLLPFMRPPQQNVLNKGVLNRFPNPNHQRSREEIEERRKQIDDNLATVVIL